MTETLLNSWFYLVSSGLIIWLGLVASLGVCLLFHYITYAYADACSLFQYAQSMKGVSRCSRYHAVVGPPKDVCDPFTDDTVFFPYNLYLHLVRFFSLDNRLRGAQVINVLFLWATGVCFGILLYGSLAEVLLVAQQRIYVSLLFSMVLISRTKLILVALGAYSEVINYFLLIFAGLVLLVLLKEPNSFWAVLLGVVCGLSYRNRPTEIILLLAVGAILVVQIGFSLLPLVFLGFFVTIFDVFWNFFKKGTTDGLGYLKFVWLAYGKNNNDLGCKEISLFSRFMAGGRRFFSICYWDSSWPSLGSSLLILPLSLWVLFKGGMPPICQFFLFYFLFYGLIFCILRQNVPSRGGNQFYFGSRPFYMAFFPVLFCNGMAGSLCLAQGSDLLLVMYVVWLICYAIHQSYKVADYYFADTIHETGNTVIAKKTQPFRKQLRDYMLARPCQSKMVMLGYYLIWGEVYDFFHCDEDLQCVSLLRSVDDQELLEWITFYGVTHIALTPMSGFIGEGCSLRQKSLGQLLRGVLVPERISDDVTIFHVNSQKRCIL